ncbi:MAG: hypothetical protein R2776_06270 [Flavobacteriaceae bacterium]
MDGAAEKSEGWRVGKNQSFVLLPKFKLEANLSVSLKRKPLCGFVGVIVGNGSGYDFGVENSVEFSALKSAFIKVRFFPMEKNTHAEL